MTDVPADVRRFARLRFKDWVELIVFSARRFRENLPVPRDERVVFTRIYSQFSALQQRAHSSSYADEALFADIYGHILTVVDIASTIITAQVNAESAISLKLLWNNGELHQPLIRTFVRDSKSREKRESVQPPNYFPVEDNTAFETIASRVADYFVSDNLTALEAEGKYRNSRYRWPYLYNATAVVGIPRGSNAPIVAFLCADTRSGVISAPRVRRSLEMLSSHLHAIFMLGFDAEVRYLQDHQNFSFSSPIASSEMGWKLEGKKLLQANPSAHSIFQSSVERLERAYQIASESENRGMQAIFRPHAERSEERYLPYAESADMDDDGDLIDQIPDSAIPEHRRKNLEAILNSSDKEFFDALAEVAEGNPHAEAMLRAAREKHLI